MTFDDHHNDPPRVWCARGMRKPKPGCCWARRLLFDRHSGRPLLVAEKKGLHRLQWMRTLRFMSFFSKRFRALGCPNWAALLMRYFESPYWEIKLGWCHGPAQQVLRTSLEWNLPKTSQAIVCLGSTHILHRAVRLSMVLRLRTLARSGRNDTDSFVQYLRDPNGRFSVGPSLRLVAVCSSKNCKENGRSFQNWRKNSSHMVFRWLQNGGIHWSPRIKSSAIHLGDCRDDPGGQTMVQVAAQHCAGSKIVRRGTNTGKTSNKDSKLAVAAWVSHLCHKFFSVVFFERDSELTLFGFGTAQSQSAEPQLEVHRASCPADCWQSSQRYYGTYSCWGSYWFHMIPHCRFHCISIAISGPMMHFHAIFSLSPGVFQCFHWFHVASVSQTVQV